MLYVEVLNNGWGNAENYTFDLLLYDKNDYAPKEITYISKPKFFTKPLDKLASNEKKVLFRIRAEYFNKKLIMKNSQNKKHSMRNTPFNHMLLDKNAIDLEATVRYRKRVSEEAYQSSSVEISHNRFGVCSHILLTSSSFLLFESPVCYSLSTPDTIYASFVDHETSEKTYNISRLIKGGGIDNFNIFVGSDRSCLFNIKLYLTYNDGKVVASSEIPISIIKYTDSKSFNRYIDGCEIATENFRKKNQIDDLYGQLFQELY